MLTLGPGLLRVTRTIRKWWKNPLPVVIHIHLIGGNYPPPANFVVKAYQKMALVKSGSVWVTPVVLWTHIIGNFGDDFYRSDDQTNRVKALKETSWSSKIRLESHPNHSTVLQ